MCPAQTVHSWLPGAEELQKVSQRLPWDPGTHRKVSLLHSSVCALSSVQSTCKVIFVNTVEEACTPAYPSCMDISVLNRKCTKSPLSGFVGPTKFWVTLSVWFLADALITVFAIFSIWVLHPFHLSLPNGMVEWQDAVHKFVGLHFSSHLQPLLQCILDLKQMHWCPHGPWW